MTQLHRRTQPITDALYGRKPKRKAPAPKPGRKPDPRRTFDVAGQLDQTTRNKLAALAGRLEKEAR